MENELPADSMNELVQLIYNGQKIAACKLYKELRGTSLVEAKAFVEKLTTELQAIEPERFAKNSGSGCSAAIFLLCVCTGVGLFSLTW